MRTNRYTGSATDAGVGYGKVILTFQNEAGIGINSRPFQKSLMLFALFLRSYLRRAWNPLYVKRAKSLPLSGEGGS